MALIFRDIKSAPLTHDEVDGNFRHLTGSHEISGSIYVQGSISASGNLTGSNLLLTSTDSVLGVSTLSASNWIIAQHITASGNISASGTIYANSFQSTGGDVAGISFHDDLNITGDITSSTTIKAEHLISTDDAVIADLLTVGHITSTGNSTLGNATNDTHTFVGNITASGNISASGNITAKDLTLSGNTNIEGNLVLGGNLTTDGNVISGDANTDSITFNADITSNIRPNTDDTYDLGTESKRWQDIHGTAINAEVLALNQITASGTSTLAAGQNGIWIGPFSISGTVDIGLGSNFVISSFNRLKEIDLINCSDY